MKTKKNMIFSINASSQIYSQFHENTSISILKSFFRDKTGYKNFAFVFNGKQLKNDTLKIREILSKNSTSLNLLIKVILNPEPDGKPQDIWTDYETIQNTTKICPCSIKENNDMLEVLKEENERLRLKDIENNDKLNQLKENYNKTSIEKECLNQKVIKLIKEKENVEREINTKHIVIESLTKENDDLRLKSSQTMETFATLQSKADYLHVQRSSYLSIFNTYGFNTYGNDISEARISKGKYTRSVENIFTSSLDEPTMPETKAVENSHELNWSIILNYNEKDECLLLEILPYLPICDLINFSITSKSHGKVIIGYLFKEAEMKKTSIDNKLKESIQNFTSSFTLTRFKNSHFSISAFKLLNKENYSQVFTEGNESVFNTPLQLITYRLLIQLTNIIPNQSDLNDEALIKEVLKTIQEGMKTNNGLGDYLKEVLGKFDYSYANIQAAIAIYKKYNITTLDCSEISKQQKTSGIISFLVKDMIFFSGIEEDLKQNTSSNRNNLLKEIDLLESSMIKYADIKETLGIFQMRNYYKS